MKHYRSPNLPVYLCNAEATISIRWGLLTIWSMIQIGWLTIQIYPCAVIPGLYLSCFINSAKDKNSTRQFLQILVFWKNYSSYRKIDRVWTAIQWSEDVWILGQDHPGITFKYLRIKITLTTILLSSVLFPFICITYLPYVPISH